MTHQLNVDTCTHQEMKPTERQIMKKS